MTCPQVSAAGPAVLMERFQQVSPDHTFTLKNNHGSDKLDTPYINKTNTHSSRNQKYFLNVYKSIINAYNINHKFLAHIKILKGQILKHLVYACVYMYPIYSKYNTFNILSILLNIFI